MKGDVVATIAAVALAAGLVASVHSAVGEAHQRAKEASDVYTLPPAEDLARISLGYRSAFADFLWAHVRVSQGLHTAEKRRFGNLTQLLDAINALDPTFRDPYLYADALITFQGEQTPRDEVLKVREILERGVRNLPDDAEIWLALGEFVAYVAPAAGYLGDEAEVQKWRSEGAKILARAAELGGDDSRISWQALGGASILNRGGERDASVRLLRRTLAITDDAELKQHIQQQLDQLLGEAQTEDYKRRSAAFLNQVRRDLPFVTSKTLVLVVGPPADPAFCAGGAHNDELACATTWRDWFDRLSPHPP